ncbi:MAG: hypothetical protein Q4C91_02505 [Eubacteriales bacterium]|nr:hypothetical protein [Eubacteriales bacterium]
MQSLLCLDIPVFKPKYKKWRRYGYTDEKEKENLKEVLIDTTGGYCMYCYSRIRPDGKYVGHLEHAIEKKNSDRLLECIPNIGLACPTCNLSFKRKGEKSRKISTQAVCEFEKKCNCEKNQRKQCTVACKALRQLQKSYSEMADADILLQPMNIKAKNGAFLRLRYDVLKMEFEPLEDNTHKITDEERRFVGAHINRFHLNDPKYRTTQLRDFVGLVIDTNGKIPVYEYNNLVVQLFSKQLEEKGKEERVKICSTIYPILVMVG